MGLLARIKAWVAKPIPEALPTVRFYPDSRGNPEYRIAVIQYPDWQLRRRVRMTHPTMPTCLEAEIWAHLNPEAPHAVPALEDEKPVKALKRAALIEFIRTEAIDARS